MRMLVMNVWIVGVLVLDGDMAMPVHMRLGQCHPGFMRMLMVLVMVVRMAVFHRFVRVFMRMVFGQVQPDTQGHQRAGDPKAGAGALAQHEH